MEGIIEGVDTMPPSTVRDLRVEKVSLLDSEVRLSWTSPGDDGYHGLGSY